MATGRGTNFGLYYLVMAVDGGTNFGIYSLVSAADVGTNFDFACDGSQRGY